MTRIRALSRDEMDAEQQKAYDETVATTGRVGRGPSVGYAYSPGTLAAAQRIERPSA